MNAKKYKFAAFAALCLAMAPILSQAQEGPTENGAHPNKIRAAMEKAMSPARDPSLTNAEIGAQSAAKSRAALQRLFSKTPGQAARDAGQSALGAGAAGAGALHRGLLALKAKRSAAAEAKAANKPTAP